MKDRKNCRRKLWWYLFAAMTVYGVVKLLGGLWVNLLYLWARAHTAISTTKAYSVGIIGGADGPTAVFVTAPVWVSYILPVLCLIVGIWGLWRLRRK